MIKSISLMFGRGENAAPEIINTTPITVFVGPNNSGKSRVLQELNQIIERGERSATDLIVKHVEFESFPSAKIEAQIERMTLLPNHGELVRPDCILVGTKDMRQQVTRKEIANLLADSNSNQQRFCQLFLRQNKLILDGRNRINLVREQNAGDLQKPSHLSLQVLFRDEKKRYKVRRIIHDAFGLHFVIDPTNLGKFRIRLAARAPVSDTEEKGINDDAVRFHSAALDIERTSDGVKAFTGIITEIVAGDPVALLLDEPEAFLHPGLALTLGKEIALASLESEKRVFISTHSPTFVMGCIQSGVPINIVRLTYRNNIATARLLPSHELLRLMRNPLLRSTGVLGGLFYEFVVVTESDTDRAF